VADGAGDGVMHVGGAASACGSLATVDV
jgi:hypothetical protein